MDRVAMDFPHETYAKDLHRALSLRCSRPPGTHVAVEGRGVNWTCSAQRRGRSCRICCFDLPRAQGAEYLAFFKDDGRDHATGRTSSQDGVVGAAGDWLDGAGLEALYVRFSFVDSGKRALTALLAETLERSPRLRASASHDVCHDTCDMYHLWFRAKDRACRVAYYGKNRFPDAFFFWDECNLFRFPVEHQVVFAEVLERWLCEDARPSALAREFACVQIGPLARYYEEGRPVEGEFLVSWDEVEEFYGRLPSPGQKMLPLIADMRQAGYDKVLRAGTSMWTLLVSRSRRHGLRVDQPRIAFLIRDNDMDVVASIDGQETLSGLEIAFVPRIDAMLKRLAEKKID
jgi:hypothetical protein